MVQATRWRNLEDPTLPWEELVTKTACYVILFIWHVHSRQTHTPIKEISGWQELQEGGLGVNANGWRFSFPGHENVLKLIMVKVAQLCKYTKNYWLVYFKSMDCMLGELYLNFLLKERKRKLRRERHIIWGKFYKIHEGTDVWDKSFRWTGQD